MSAIWLVLPLAILFAGLAVLAFIWTVKSGQLDDLDTPSIRPLVDDADEGLEARAEGGKRVEHERPERC